MLLKTEYIKPNTIKRMFHDNGIEYVRTDAVHFLVDYLQSEVIRIAEKSKEYAKLRTKKTVTKKDIKLVLDLEKE